MRNKMKVGMLAAILTICSIVNVNAHRHDYPLQDIEIIHECDTIWHFGYKGVNLYSRSMHRIDIAYPSVDAKGNDIRLSGSIIIPSNVYDGDSPVDGVLLYNRYTQMQPECKSSLWATTSTTTCSTGSEITTST